MRQEISVIPAKEPGYYLVQLAKGTKKSSLVKKGISIIRTVSPEYIIVKADQQVLKQNARFYKTANAVNNLWKLERALLTVNKSVTQHFTVRTNSPRRIIHSLRSIRNIRGVKASGNVLTVHASLGAIIDHVIGLEEVTYAGIESRTPREESRVLDLYLSPNTVNKLHHLFPDLNGEGTVVSIRESKYNTEDVDLQGRDIPSSLAGTEVSNHATEMATIAAGAGNSFINGRGVAKEANITSSDFGDLLPDDDNDYFTLNAWVQNHAYGTAVENFYGALAQAYDESANRLPELLHVFSSGNQGTATADHGTYRGIAGMANLTGNFKMAKNILTVGAVDTLLQPVFFSSRGPAYDGRIKPEVVAYSTQGSSNAAALVSGVVSLLQQAYKRKEGSLPASALLKALLINSAKDAGTPGIDFATGFGNVDAFRTLQCLQNGNYFSGSIAQGAIKTFDLMVPADASDLKVTLVWNDPAAVANSAIALVNDLDMRIENGETWLPWVLDSSPDKNKLSQPAKRKTDHLNTVEQVSIKNPQPGSYTIRIEGYDVLQGSQDFYIAYQWDTLDQFVWTFPTGSDNLPYDGETGTCFYWKSTLTETSGRLEYSVDGGASWKVLSEAVDLEKGYYRWNANAIPHITSFAHARIVAGDAVYPTEQFIISRPVGVSIGFNCADSVMFQWSSVPGADRYEIYNFSESLMKPFSETADTFLIIKKGATPSALFAVEPVLLNGKSTLRSPLFDHTLLGTDCFLLSFVDEVVPEEGIYLTLQLGTTYSIDQLYIEHEQGSVFEPVTEMVPDTRTIRFLHDSPNQGLNRYRARIEFNNGEEFISDIIEDYFLTDIPFIVFPNPVSASHDVRIFSKIFNVQNATFRLFKSDGSLVFTTQLFSDREFIPLNGIIPGLYLYRITSEEGYFNGRLVVMPSN